MCRIVGFINQKEYITHNIYNEYKGYSNLIQRQAMKIIK